jgi:hypothetical protein
MRNKMNYEDFQEIVTFEEVCEEISNIANLINRVNECKIDYKEDLFSSFILCLKNPGNDLHIKRLGKLIERMLGNSDYSAEIKTRKEDQPIVNILINYNITDIDNNKNNGSMVIEAKLGLHKDKETKVEWSMHHSPPITDQFVKEMMEFDFNTSYAEFMENQENMKKPNKN